MEMLLKFETRNLQKMKDILLKHDTVSRSSITFKDAKQFGTDGYYCFISGTDEQCKIAAELTKDIAKEIKDKEREKVISTIKEESDKAAEGLGGIFG